MSNGRFCGSPAINDDDYCYFHRAARERVKRQARHARQQKPLQLPLLEDRESIQIAIGEVLNALLADRIDTKKAGLLLYGLQTAAGNAQHLAFEVSAHRSDLAANYDNDEEETLEQEIAEEAAEEAAQNPPAKVASAQPDTGTTLPAKKPAQSVIPEEPANSAEPQPTHALAPGAKRGRS